MRDVEAGADQGDPRCRLALDVYAYRVKKYIGAYAAAMGGLDVLVFTAGVGENDAGMRAAVCDGLGFLGIELDQAANGATHAVARDISAAGARVRVLVMPTDEEGMIAEQTVEVVEALPALQVGVVVTIVGEQPAPVDLDDAGGHALQKRPVVGHEDERLVESEQEVLEPDDRIDVEVVGGLVEQQHVGLVGEGPRQRHSMSGQPEDAAEVGVSVEADPAHRRCSTRWCRFQAPDVSSLCCTLSSSLSRPAAAPSSASAPLCATSGCASLIVSSW